MSPFVEVLRAFLMFNKPEAPVPVKAGLAQDGDICTLLQLAAFI